MSMRNEYEDLQKGAFKALVEEGIYDEDFSHSSVAEQFFTGILGEVLLKSKREPISILDSGCGPGAWLAVAHDLSIEHRRANVELYGFDITPEMIDLARKRLTGRVADENLRQGDVLELGSYQFLGHKNGFDIIYSYDVIQQLPPKLQFQACLNLSQMLKAGGTGVIFDHERQSSYGRKMAAKKFATQYLRLPLVPRYYCNAKYPPLAKFARQIEQQGCYETEIRIASASPKRALIIRRKQSGCA